MVKVVNYTVQWDCTKINALTQCACIFSYFLVCCRIKSHSLAYIFNLCKLCLLLLQHSNVYRVLLTLADFCPVPGVRENAVQLLNSLPTHSLVLDSLRAALQGSQPVQQFVTLLQARSADGTVGIPHARLLYTLQASTSTARCCAWPLHAGQTHIALIDRKSHHASLCSSSLPSKIMRVDKPTKMSLDLLSSALYFLTCR